MGTATWSRDWRIVASPLSVALGRPIRDQVYTERNNDATMLQALEMVNGDTINIDDIPARAFDSPEERQYVAAILDQYNNDSNLTPEEDRQFAQIAEARTARHPLRTYLYVPLQRVVTLWFTPRVEQLPISGPIFPLARLLGKTLPLRCTPC